MLTHRVPGDKGNDQDYSYDVFTKVRRDLILEANSTFAIMDAPSVLVERQKVGELSFSIDLITERLRCEKAFSISLDLSSAQKKSL